MKKKIASVILSILLITIIIPVAVSAIRIDTANCINVTIGNNSPPDPPKITIPDTIVRGRLFKLEMVTTDPDGDDIYYRVDCPDLSDIWLGSFPSGMKFTMWVILKIPLGTYTLGIQAKDIYDAESDWAYVQFNLTKTKTIDTSFLNFFQRYTYINLILGLILQRSGL